MMYCLNKHHQGEWEQKYEHFDNDADAMTWARSELGNECNMVSLYRHDDDDSCGIKHFIAGYEL